MRSWGSRRAARRTPLHTHKFPRAPGRAPRSPPPQRPAIRPAGRRILRSGRPAAAEASAPPETKARRVACSARPGPGPPSPPPPPPLCSPRLRAQRSTPGAPTPRLRRSRARGARGRGHWRGGGGAGALAWHLPRPPPPPTSCPAAAHESCGGRGLRRGRSPGSADLSEGHQDFEEALRPGRATSPVE